MQEMLAIAKKRDLAAFLIIESATQAEFQLHMDTSWSCLRIEPDEGKGQGLRIRSQLADYPSKEAQRESLEATVGMIFTALDIMQKWAAGFHELSKTLREKFDIEHTSTVEELTKVRIPKAQEGAPRVMTEETMDLIKAICRDFSAVAVTMEPSRFRDFLVGVIANTVGHMPDDYFNALTTVVPCGKEGCLCHETIGAPVSGAFHALRKGWKEALENNDG